MFWPSFNSVYLLQHDMDEAVPLNVICSTYLSMAVSAVTAIAISILSNPQGKINMVSPEDFYMNMKVNHTLASLDSLDIYFCNFNIGPAPKTSTLF